MVIRMYRILTDSTADLTEELLGKYQSDMLSLNYYVDDKMYKGYTKGQKTDLSHFYAMMREQKEISTSLANVEDAIAFMEPYLKAEEDIFYIAFSSGLSGTCQAVMLAIEELKDKYPERKIYCVDSLAAALGEGLLVYYAFQNRENGMTIEENVNWVEEHKLKLCHWFTVDDLFFLKRGGRISAATAIVGTALKIKPVLHVDDEGHLIAMENVRGRKKAIHALVKKMQETIIEPEKQEIFISHGDCLEEAEYLAQKVKEALPVKNIMLNILDPVIGSHAGPGTLAVFFMGEHR